MWTFHVQASPIAWKDKNPEYQVRVKAVRKGNIRDLEKADIRLACTCPFWRWQGPEHWAKVSDYLYGKPRGTASDPKVKDPSGENRLCKHVIAVVDHMRGKGMQVLAPRR